MKIAEFQKLYVTKEAKEKQLEKMSDEEIQELVDSCTSIYGKIWYSGFLKNKKK